MIAFASSLDQCGPLTRDVTDAALLLRALEGRDPCDSTSVGIEGGVGLPSREDLKGLSFGVPRELAGDAEGIEAGVRELFERTVALIEELGGEVSETELPHAPHGISAYYVLAPAEASANLARYDGVRFGPRERRRGPDRDVRAHARTTASATRSSGGSCSAPTRSRSGYYEAYYGRAQKVRTKIAEDFAAAFESFDFVVTPDLADGRLRAGGAHRRPAGDVPERLLHGADAARRHPGDLDPGGPRRARRRGPRAPGGLPDRRAGVQRDAACSTPPSRSSARSASRGAPE